MAPRGNPNPKGSKPDKLVKDALIVALNREAAGADGRPTKKLYQLAEAMVDKAVSGDVAAATFVTDRVEGKPHQTLEHSGEIETSSVARIPHPASTMDEWQKNYPLKPTVQ